MAAARSNCSSCSAAWSSCAHLGTGVSRVSAGQFLRARAGRLLPVYAIALAAAAVALFLRRSLPRAALAGGQ